MSFLSSIVYGCVFMGHDWEDKGSYLLCTECDEVKKL